MKYSDTFEETFQSLEREAALLGLAVEHAADLIGDEAERARTTAQGLRPQLIALMGLGVFLNDVQICRRRALELAARVPGVNGLPEEYQEVACDLGQRLFRLAERTRRIERRTWDLAADNLTRALDRQRLRNLSTQASAGDPSSWPASLG